MIHPDLYLQFQVVLNIAGRKKKNNENWNIAHDSSGTNLILVSKTTSRAPNGSVFQNICSLGKF